MTAPVRHLVIFAKAPRIGRVKTRLARDIGQVPAWGFYRHMLAALVRRLAHDRRWRTVLAVAPDTAAGVDAIWPKSVLRARQGGGDLGQRMQRAFDLLEPGPVVIIGADIPGIRPDHIAAAFAALGTNDAVFGPAEDGGYWLVGQKRTPRTRSIFGNVRWSGPHALADTRANLPGAGVALLPPLYDIDDGDDYLRWRRDTVKSSQS